MRLLLTTINTDNRHSELEMRYLHSVLHDAPIELDVRIFDRYDTASQIYERIMQSAYDIVYMHTDSRNISTITAAVQMIKKASPDIGIILGGMEVSFETYDFMRSNPCVDYVIRGEGETVMYNFVRSVLERTYRFESIAGLAYRTGGDITVNPFDDPIDMNELPFPYVVTDLDRDTVYYESIRGTADRSIHRQYLPDPRIRSLGINRVCTELRYFLAENVGKIVFFDRWFNYNNERAYRIFEFIINNDNGTTSYEFNINGDNLDDETIRLLSDARPGMITFNIDIGSTNAEVLDAMGRRGNVYQLMYNVTKLMKSGNVDVNVIIAAGLPYETETMFARSFNKAYGLAAGMPLHIEELFADKGTTLRKQAERYGYIHSGIAPYEVISGGHMSSFQLLRIKKTAEIVDAFIGEGGFKASIPRILNDTGSRPYELFKSLSMFVTDKGIEVLPNAKDELAGMLYEFAEGLYEEMGDIRKLETLEAVILDDLEEVLTEDEVKQLKKHGLKSDKTGTKVITEKTIN